MLKFALLGLLAQRDRHGYDLKSAFEELTGGTWPLNIGQVYTTLARLERDGLVANSVVAQELLPDRKVYALTPDGWDELTGWLAEPVTGAVRLKDELFVKILIHSLVDAGEPVALIWAQRKRELETLAELTRLRDDPAQAPATALLLEGAVLHVQADLAWLDRCEERVATLKGPSR